MNDAAPRGPAGSPNASAPRHDVVVVGAGIAGLACAHRLSAEGLDVVVVEASARVGGKIGSVRDDGFLLEQGPNSFLGSARAIWPLVDELGLGGRLMQAGPPGTRWIYRGGRARTLPSGLWSAATGDWLPLAAKLRVAYEAFVAAAPSDDETLYDFVARRCGDDFAAGVIAPFTSGVYAGDPHQLGAKDAFLRMWNLEAEHGGLIRGARALARQRRAAGVVVRAGLWNFDDGLGVLTDALAAQLQRRASTSLRCNRSVAALQREGAGWSISLTSTAPSTDAADDIDDIDDIDDPPTLHADAVVLALPQHALAALVAPLSAAAAAALAQSPVATVAVVHLGGADPSGSAPRGFGALIARGEGVRALGVLVPSSLFAGRAPEGSALFSVFLGGVTDPEAVDLDDATLIDLARSGRRTVFGAAADPTPTLARVTRWGAAIPQYVVGHRARVAQARALLATAAPGLWLCGAACDGVSIDDAAASGLAAAAGVLAQRLGSAGALAVAS